ncbi:adenylate/guanylate cyclase domain-containing protein [Rhizobium laguerreae]|uniref:adenylate/guanylate cyclase domain-containing protein n=1 Tax=Rhizobium laguerreae TaxID=1076926 RepID=UPI001C9052BB|nr:adenylate/guanylate cyclase domain-containing protein [Rhizobium laguerreae]MBY3180626.1 adenylate/guanylate cyclase domain-containing protein [Rhizobium laguerreae]MBY3380417.1 adenylate/guanylate cyclase domain-containing protein [Rhizobium laguerreae]
MREISPTQNWILITIVLAASGVIYDLMFYSNQTPIIGAIFALFIGMPILAFERKVLFRALYRRIQKLPTFAFIITELLIYEILMSIGFACAGLLLWWLGMVKPVSLFDLVIMPFEVFLYALAVCTMLIFVLRVRELLGREVFLSMLISRYRNPVKEERVFLFIDLVDSTAFAEKHGDLRAQQLLSSLFATFAEPVRRNKGMINDYVGDAAIITWPLARGVKDARCVRCIFDILADIEANAAGWRKNYGQVPKLRAALHGGEIITAEIGVDHHKISYFGDTVNTTARLETLCRSLNRSVLISSELARRIKFPDDISCEDLGTHAVKGRGQALGVMALSSRAVTVLNTPAVILHG